jgi:hypothetical protein
MALLAAFFPALWWLLFLFSKNTDNSVVKWKIMENYGTTSVNNPTLL